MGNSSAPPAAGRLGGKEPRTQKTRRGDARMLAERIENLFAIFGRKRL
jgi:hypothetical protein